MLSFNWDFLTWREKRYFNHSEKLFLEKKQKLIEISEITKTMRSLHERLKIIDEGEEMQDTAEQIIEFDYKRTQLFKELDQWQ